MKTLSALLPCVKRRQPEAPQPERHQLADRRPQAKRSQTTAPRDGSLSDVLAKQPDKPARPFTIIPKPLQKPAAANQIFALQKSGMDYRLVESENGKPLDNPEPHGDYVFAIKASDPKTVLVGKHVLPGATPQPHDNLAVEGHSSITHGENALYAGTAWFNKGILKSWSNDSGHYRPNAHARHSALTSDNKQLLPESKFIRHKHQDG